MERSGKWMKGLACFFLLAGCLPLSAKLGFQASIGRVRNEGVAHPASGFMQPNWGTGFGLQLGMVYCREIGPSQVLRLGALYALKGDKTTMSLWIYPQGGQFREKTPCTINARYGYFEVPLVLEQYVSRRKQGFHLLGGLYAAWLLSAEMSGLEDRNRIIFGDDYSSIKPADFGWIIGLGTRAKKSRAWRPGFNVKLEVGLADLAGEKFFRYPNDGASNNVALLVSFIVLKGG